jgi:DNA invertase Pin-like site-specific DNA recombinase
MKVGYARVSTSDKHQSTEPQLRKLREAGCTVTFADDGESGTKASRPEWDKCLASLQPGDTLVAVRLDRFGRSVQHLLKLSEDLAARGIDLQCTDQPIDTTSSVGKLVFVILAAVAEFERSITVERVKDGLAVAVANGKQIGRPSAISDEQVRTARKLRANGVHMSEVCTLLGCKQSTLYRRMSEAAA